MAGSHGAHAVPALPRFGQQHVIAVRNLVASAGNGTPEVLVAAGSLRDAADGLAAPAGPRPVALTELAEACCGAQAAVGPASASTAPGLAAAAPWALAAAGVAAGALALKRLYDTPSRAYDGNVGDEYDAWTEEGILEHYWGEHIHLGYYTDAERAAGWWKADFKANKLRFTQEMFAFSRSKSPRRILDVGCGFGGSSRWLAAQFPDAEVVGASPHPSQPTTSANPPILSAFAQQAPRMQKSVWLEIICLLIMACRTCCLCWASQPWFSQSPAPLPLPHPCPGCAARWLLLQASLYLTGRFSAEQSSHKSGALIM